MTGLTSILVPVAALGVILWFVRRYVKREGAKISGILDACDYVVLEAHPQQGASLKADFEKHSWPFRSEAQTTGLGRLYTFVRRSNASPPLSRLLGVGTGTALLSGKKSEVDFQMKIKAHGPKKDLDA